MLQTDTDFPVYSRVDMSKYVFYTLPPNNLGIDLQYIKCRIIKYCGSHNFSAPPTRISYDFEVYLWVLCFSFLLQQELITPINSRGKFITSNLLQKKSHKLNAKKRTALCWNISSEGWFSICWVYYKVRVGLVLLGIL